MEVVESRRLLSATLLADLVPGMGSSNPVYLTPIGTGSTAIFTTQPTGTTFSTTGVWVTDGTPAGTQQVFAGAVGVQASWQRSPFLPLGDRILFFGSTPTHGMELRSLDLATNAVSLVADLQPGSANSWTEENGSLIPFGGKAYFDLTTTSSGGRRLFVTDGTVAGTSVALPNELIAAPWAVSSGLLLSTPAGILLSDGTPASTRRITFNGEGSQFGGSHFVQMDDTLWFVDRDRLYAASLTVEGPQVETPPAFGTLFVQSSRFGAPRLLNFAGRLYFTNGRSLYSTATPGAFAREEALFVSDSGFSLNVFQGALYAMPGQASSAAAEGDLLRVDASGQVTFLGRSAREGFAAVGADRYVQAVMQGELFGVEPTISFGSSLSERLLADVEPGEGSSNPAGFVVLGNRVLFSASRFGVGRELFAVTIPAAPPVGTLAVRSFLDDNVNGVFDAGERAAVFQGRSPREVFDDSNDNGVHDAGEAIIQIDGEFVQAIPGVNARTYRMRLGSSGGLAPSPGRTQPISVTVPASASATLDLPFISGPAFRGSVFDDQNGNRRFDAGEPNMAGVTVFVDIDRDGTLDPDEPSGVTGTDGVYLFANGVPPGPSNVFLRAVPPAGYNRSAPWPETQLQIFSTPSLYQVPAIGLSQLPALGAIVGSVITPAGTVPVDGELIYVDLDFDGILDPGEPSSVVASDSSYRIERVPFGPQLVRQALPAAWRSLTVSQWVNVRTNQPSSASPFLRARVAQPGETVVSGDVFIDADRDGVRDADEVALGPSSLSPESGGYKLTNVSTGQAIAIVTDGFGAFEAVLPSAGRYRLSFPAGRLAGIAWGGKPFEFDIAAGQRIDNLDIGVILPASVVTGRAFYDVNLDGVRDASEPPVFGVAEFSSLFPAGTSDGLGRVLFGSGYQAGLFVLPATYDLVPWAVLPDHRPTVMLDGRAAVDLGDVPLVPRSSLVQATIDLISFNDANANGVQDSGEQESALLSLDRYVDVNDDGQFDPAVDVDLSPGLGTRSLPIAMLPGTSRMVRIRYFGFANGSERGVPTTTQPVLVDLVAGPTPGEIVVTRKVALKVDSPSTGRTLQVTPRLDVNADGVAESNAVGPRQFWIDINNDAVLDPGEPRSFPIRGIESFHALPFGTYRVRPVLPPGWTQTVPADGGAITVTIDAQSPATVSVDSLQRETAFSGSISGTFFADRNRDAVFQSNELSFQAFDGYLDLNLSGVLDFGEPFFTMTSSTTFSVTGLQLGTYTVRQTLRPGWTQTTPDYIVTLTAAQPGVSNVNLGSTNSPLQTYVTTRVFHDVDRNGTFNAGDSLAPGFSVTIERLAPDDAVLSTTTSTQTLASLEVGWRYRVRASITGVVWSPIATGPQPVGGYLLDLRDVSRPPNVAIDFGFAPERAITGVAFVDSDNDGVLDVGESPVANATVYVDENNNGILDFMEASTRTDLAGAYFLAPNDSPGRVRISGGSPNGDRPYPNAPVVYRPIERPLVSSVNFAIPAANITTPPALSLVDLDLDYRPRLVLNFNKWLARTLMPAELVVRSVATGQIVNFARTVGLGSGPTVAVITIDSTTSPTPNGLYEVTIAAGAIADGSGRQNVDPIVVRFPFLRGDADGNGQVNFDDLLLLATSYNASTSSYRRGDFNGDGAVNFNDLLILASNYNLSLATGPALLVASPPSPPFAGSSSASRGTPPVLMDDDDNESLL